PIVQTIQLSISNPVSGCWGRRTRSQRFILFAFTMQFCTAITFGASQPDFSKVQIKATKVAGTVYMLEGSGGNIGASIGDDGVVIIDDQFAPLAPKIREALKGI